MADAADTDVVVDASPVKTAQDVDVDTMDADAQETVPAAGSQDADGDVSMDSPVVVEHSDTEERSPASGRLMPTFIESQQLSQDLRDVAGSQASADEDVTAADAITEQQIADAVDEYMRSAEDIDNVNVRQVLHVLQQKFGVDLKSRKALVKEAVVTSYGKLKAATEEVSEPEQQDDAVVESSESDAPAPTRARKPRKPRAKKPAAAPKPPKAKAAPRRARKPVAEIAEDDDEDDNNEHVNTKSDNDEDNDADDAIDSDSDASEADTGPRKARRRATTSTPKQARKTRQTTPQAARAAPRRAAFTKKAGEFIHYLLQESMLLEWARMVELSDSMYDLNRVNLEDAADAIDHLAQLAKDHASDADFQDAAEAIHLLMPMSLRVDHSGPQDTVVQRMRSRLHVAKQIKTAVQWKRLEDTTEEESKKSGAKIAAQLAWSLAIAEKTPLQQLKSLVISSCGTLVDPPFASVQVDKVVLLKSAAESARYSMCKGLGNRLLLWRACPTLDFATSLATPVSSAELPLFEWAAAALPLQQVTTQQRHWTFQLFEVATGQVQTVASLSDEWSDEAHTKRIAGKLKATPVPADMQIAHSSTSLLDLPLEPDVAGDCDMFAKYCVSDAAQLKLRAVVCVEFRFAGDAQVAADADAGSIVIEEEEEEEEEIDVSDAEPVQSPPPADDDDVDGDAETDPDAGVTLDSDQEM